MKITLLSLIIVIILPSISLAKNLKLGGSDTGGGTGIFINNQLVLKDFANCSVEPIKELYLYKESDPITNSITRINSVTIADAILKNARFDNPIFEKILLTATKRANFYLVDATIEGAKLAIFKRPLGILIDKNLFAKLNPANQIGLLFHESLRMLSIGFDFPIEESVLEKITCQSFSNLKTQTSLEEYSQLNNFISFFHNPTLLEQILIDLENVGNLNDIDFPLLFSSPYSFLYQTETSKFENIRNYIPSSNVEKLDEVFFNWASIEVPTSCSSESDCNYYEEWPENPASIFINFQKWTLIANNSNYSGWKNELNQVVYIAKDEKRKLSCDNITPKNKILPSGIEFLLDRNNLDYFSIIFKENARNSFCITQDTIENL
jgi:hypothetical protein